jgi:hypothetical protein
MVPNGKGWGEQSADLAPGVAAVNQSVITGNGISYHGGPVMPGTVNVYFIWYGNWTNGPHASDISNDVGDVKRRGTLFL